MFWIIFDRISGITITVYFEGKNNSFTVNPVQWTVLSTQALLIISTLVNLIFFLGNSWAQYMYFFLWKSTGLVDLNFTSPEISDWFHK